MCLVIGRAGGTAVVPYATRGAHTIVLQLGWCLFGNFLRASTGLDDMDDRTFVRSNAQTVASIPGAKYRGGR